MGRFELPLAVEAGNPDGVYCIGALLRGDPQCATAIPWDDVGIGWRCYLFAASPPDAVFPVSSARICRTTSQEPTVAPPRSLGLHSPGGCRSNGLKQSPRQESRASYVQAAGCR